MASSSSSWPGLMRPSRTPWSSASGIEAAEVLACSVDGGDHLGLVDAQPVGDALQDALVGLVRDEPVDLGDLDAGVRGRGGAPPRRC